MNRSTKLSSRLLLALVLSFGSGAFASVRLAAQNLPSRQDYTRGHRILRQIRQDLERYYYDSTYHGIDLDAGFQLADSSIDRAQSLPEIYGTIAQVLADLNDSHTSFDPPGLQNTAEYGWSMQAIGDQCYVVYVKEGSDAEQKGLSVGDRVLAIDGIAPTRKNEWMINYVYYRLSPRPGMRLAVERPDGTRSELTILAEIKRGSPVVNVKDLDQRRFILEERRRRSRPLHLWRSFGDSVMVWRMRRFAFRDNRNIDRHMRRARQHKVLILDLRGNGGGAVVTLQRLLGHFFDEEITIGTVHRRTETKPLTARPVGDEPFKGELIILLDSRSASASEILARTMQLQGRATIVGDRSAGSVMTSRYYPRVLGTDFDERVLAYGLSITVSDVVMPDSSQLEHVGVIPNIGLLPTPQDLAEKRNPVMAFALELAGVAMDPLEAVDIFKERD